MTSVIRLEKIVVIFTTASGHTGDGQFWFRRTAKAHSTKRTFQMPVFL